MQFATCNLQCIYANVAHVLWSNSKPWHLYNCFLTTKHFDNVLPPFFLFQVDQKAIRSTPGTSICAQNCFMHLASLLARQYALKKIVTYVNMHMITAACKAKQLAVAHKWQLDMSVHQEYHVSLIYIYFFLLKQSTTNNGNIPFNHTSVLVPFNCCIESVACSCLPT